MSHHSHPVHIQQTSKAAIQTGQIITNMLLLAWATLPLIHSCTSLPCVNALPRPRTDPLQPNNITCIASTCGADATITGNDSHGKQRSTCIGDNLVHQADSLIRRMAIVITTSSPELGSWGYKDNIFHRSTSIQKSLHCITMSQNVAITSDHPDGVDSNYHSGTPRPTPPMTVPGYAETQPQSGHMKASGSSDLKPNSIENQEASTLSPKTAYTISELKRLDISTPDHRLGSDDTKTQMNRVKTKYFWLILIVLIAAGAVYKYMPGVG